MNFKKLIKECSELTLYHIIKEIGGNIWAINHNSADGRIEFRDYEETYNDLRRKIKLAVNQTKRFGVIPLGDNDLLTQSYWEWYRTWKKEAIIPFKCPICKEEVNIVNITRGLPFGQIIEAFCKKCDHRWSKELEPNDLIKNER